MRKKISLVILSNSGASVKQLTISKAFLKGFAIFCLVAFGVLSYDYYTLKATSFLSSNNAIQLSSQQEEIVRQRQQIQDFASEISELKNKLVDLNNFEKKIRIIANIENVEEQNNLFGVGGSIPEDLDAQIPLTQKHNSLLREMHEQVDQLHLATINQNQGFETLFKFPAPIS